MSITVDSTPILVGPASSMASILPARSFMTCSAVVGLGFPARFALGAEIGVIDSLIKASATLLLGILMAIVSKPTTVMSGTSFDRFRTRVKGPGQNWAISFSAVSGTFLASVYTSSLLAM